MNKGISMLLTMTILSGIALMSNTTSATKSVSNASVTVPEACTMTGSGMNSHTATITPGTFSASSGSDYENGIGKTTFTVVCNDYNGFSIYAIGYTGNSYDDTNHTKLVGSNTNVAIDTAVYSGGDTTSSWSMKVNKVTDSTISYLPANMSIQNSFDSWHTIPDTYTKVAQYKASTGSSTTDTTLGAKIDTTYAAFIAPNQPGDTYIGQVKYTMVHPYNNTPKDGPMLDCPDYYVCFSPGANDVIGTMTNYGIGPNNQTTLWASNFSREGYGFAGWNTEYDYSGTFYGPSETITTPQSITEGGMPLYAVWVRSEGSLQDSTKVATLCGTGPNSLVQAPDDNTANLSSVSALTDQRDNQTYAIAKLADGNCWIIENLRLDNQYTTGTTNALLAQGYGGVFNGLANPEEVSRFGSSRDSNSLYSIDGSSQYIISGGTLGTESVRIPRYNNDTTSNRQPNLGSNNAAMYSYGNYYNWPAAIANTNDLSQGDHNGTSICPSGWKIPIGKLAGSQLPLEQSFTALILALGGSTGTGSGGQAVSRKLTSFPNNFVFSGYLTSTGVSSRGSVSELWSSTATNNYTATVFLLNSTYVEGGGGSYARQSGYPVRCLTPPNV